MTEPRFGSAYFHLPGMYEFFPFYQKFLPLFFTHPEYFYPWAKIASLYGAPEDAIWSGGRVEYSQCSTEDVLSLLSTWNISARLTFSNSMLQPQHLQDPTCNHLCSLLAEQDGNGVILHSELLLAHMQAHFPSLYLVSSTTKVLTDFYQLLKETSRSCFRYVVPDFRLNKAWSQFESMSPVQRGKLEMLCNECCWIGCRERRKCYETVSRSILGEDIPDHRCPYLQNGQGYRFSKAMESPAFISLDDIQQRYLPLGITNFKIEGRGLGSGLLLEFLLYYLTKPQYHIHVREHLYLDNMLDLF